MRLGDKNGEIRRGTNSWTKQEASLRNNSPVKRKVSFSRDSIRKAVVLKEIESIVWRGRIVRMDSFEHLSHSNHFVIGITTGFYSLLFAALPSQSGSHIPPCAAVFPAPHKNCGPDTCKCFYRLHEFRPDVPGDTTSAPVRRIESDKTNDSIKRVIRALK